MKTFKNTEEKIKFLIECSKKYEHSGTSEISDQEYDLLYAEAQSEDPDNIFFDTVGGELEDNVYGQKLPHKIIMGSLSKCLSIKPDFEKWLFSTFDIKDKPQFLLQHKVDGLSLSLVFDKRGKLVQALTRGNGEMGISVLANCQYIKDIPQTIPYQDEVEVRGEIYKDRSSFKEWKEKGYSDERSFAAGSLNQKDPSETGRRELSFVAYEVLRKDDFEYQQEKITFLEKMGFKTLKSTTKTTKEGNSFDQIVKAVDYYMNNIDRKSLPHLIDGVVVKLCDIKKARSMGSVAKKPKSDKAIKYPSQTASTILLDIEVNVGRSGKLCPVGILKEVEIDGSKITRVTLHNFGMITGKDALKIGAKVIIARKNDIIPQIISVVENNGKSFEITDKCPSCGEKVEWTNSGVDLVCSNPDCISQLNNKIEYFLKEAGIEGIGPGIISKLTELSWEGKPIISSLPEIFYKLDNDRDKDIIHPFRKYTFLKEQFGPKNYENILESIKSVKELSLTKFLQALGISKVGSMTKEIAKIAPSISDIDNLTKGDLLKIPGFGPEKANSFINSWKIRRKEIETLLKYISIKQDVKTSTKLSGKKFCFTGSFSKSRDELEKMVEDNSGVASSSVGKGVILVHDGVITGSKFDKAKSNGNEIILEEDFLAMLK